MNTQTSAPSGTPVYNFADESPILWEEFLKKSAQAGTAEVTSEVSWSAHEASRGVYDFAKSSRLRIEKFMTLAAQAGVKVRFDIGISADREAFPKWTEGMAEPIRLPSEVLLHRYRWYGHSTVPHFFDDEIRKSFLSFLGEVFQRIQLYRAPEGPVAGVSINLGPLPYCQTLGTWPEFVAFLREEYGTIADLNRFFQTSFKEFESLTSALSFRTLLDRRPWQACYDFKKFRSLRLNALWSDVMELVKTHELSDVFQATWLENRVIGFPNRGLHFDGTLVDSVRHHCPILLSPWSQENPALIRSARLLEALFDSCTEEGFFCAALENSILQEKSQTLSVVCGRHITSAAERTMKAWLESGRTLHFPSQSPKYTEKLTAVTWPLEGPAKRISIGGEAYLEGRVHGGRLLHPVKEEELGSGTLPTILNVMELIS